MKCEECGTLLLTLERLKRQAKLLGMWFPELKHSDALEKMSKLHGHKDYHTAKEILETREELQNKKEIETCTQKSSLSAD